MSDVRVRRHTDGRIAVCTELADGPYRWLVWPPYGRLTDEHVAGEGWCELLVAELPEPDDTITTELGMRRVSFGRITANIADGYQSIDNEMCIWNVDGARRTALNLLAAVDACERYRAEQET